MEKPCRNIYVFAALCAVYALVFYMQITQQLRLDFSSFYSTSLAVYQGFDPYQNLLTTYFPIAKKLPANLNPPLFLLLLHPFAQLPYYLAVPLWASCSFILGVVGAIITAQCAFSEKKNQFALVLIYLALFATLMNTVIAQMGAVILFFIMAGYYCYSHGKDYLAGSLWAIIAALKLFPALLFIFALRQKRYRVAIAFILVSLLLWLVPLYLYGITVYQQYFHMLTRVLWYGDSWNGSIYGFLFRLFIDPNNRQQSLLVIKLSYLLLFIVLLAWYVKKSGAYPAPPANVHYPFCFTLVMMLLLSPFGWLYYFSLLLLPLALTWQQLTMDKAASPTLLILWFTSFFLLNLPLDYVMSTKMTGWVEKVFTYSLYFYGLLLFAFLVITLLGKRPQQTFNLAHQAHALFLPVSLILLFGLAIPLSYFFVRLFAMT